MGILLSLRIGLLLIYCIGDFNDIGLGGLYYMFQSIENSFNYFDQFYTRYTDEMSFVIDNVANIRTGLNIPSGAPKASLDMYSILGAAFSIVSAAGTAAPAIGGPTAGLSGLMYLLSGTASSDVSPNDAVEAKDSATKLMIKVRDDGRAVIEDIIGGMFGRKGTPQSKIPEPMLVGDAKYKNPCVRVFGWGAWVKDDALEGLKDMIHTMRGNMVSHLLFVTFVYPD